MRLVKEIKTKFATEIIKKDLFITISFIIQLYVYHQQ
jgi:hypothetical protein